MFENYIDWSITYYKDDISSVEGSLAETTVKWIIGGKRKWLVVEHLDQQPVKDLIINVHKMKPTQLSMKQQMSVDLFIDEAFKENPRYLSYITDSEISDPSNF